VLLVAENGTHDPAAGHEGGVAMARRALADARSIGYPDGLPIFFCADAWLAENHIPVATAMSYLDGAASVVGRKRTGAYGFRDFVEAARAGHHATWLWLCGAPPTDSEVGRGWPHFYQFNGGSIELKAHLDADLDWAYPGVLDALQAGALPPDHYPAHSHEKGQAPPWPLPPGHYFGLITGPAVSHGGHYAADRGWVQQIQRALIRKGFVPGISAPNPGWADGKFEEPTRQAVLRFQRSAGYALTGNIGPGDWTSLLA
jgi:Rv2525c-like, glycoside hydrolase-like domain/Putative peptidoglycan binding domain